jgi:hypothetical protein
MKKTPLVILGLALTVCIINSCSKGGDDDGNTNCNGVAKSWSVNVNPIIQTYCNQSGCHASGSGNGPGPLTNYTEVFNARTQIRGQIEAGLMPQNATLTTAQKNSIICWIDSGAPNN